MADIKTLSSYAIIEHLWNSNKDFIEVYSLMAVPALVEANTNNQPVIDAISLKNYFSDHYGLTNITVGAATKFLDNLAKRHDVVCKDYQRYVIKSTSLAKICQLIDKSPDLSSDIERIVKDIVKYASEKHNQILNDDDISNGLLDFFDNNAGALTIEQKDLNDVVKLRYKNKGRKQKIKFIVSEYIKKLNDDKSSDFDILLKFSVGHLVASAVTFRTMPDYDPSLKGLSIYIDAPLILNILGLSGEIAKRLAEELITILRNRKARLILAAPHYSEVNGAINHAIGLLNAEFPDQSNINKIYDYAVHNGLSASDLELILQRVKSLCEEFGIEILNHPVKESGYTNFTVDYIYEVVMDVFEKNLGHALPSQRKLSAKRDSSVLRNVFSLRAHSSNNKLKDAGSILITNNTGLCVASSDPRLSPDACVYPAAILTENMSMIMWLESPTEDTELQKFIIIDQCMKALHPKTDIIRMFYNDIRVKHANNQVSDEEYRAVVTSKVVRGILTELTLNDHNLYTDETALQVMARLRELSEIKASEKHDRTERGEKHLKNIANKVADIICVLIASILLLLALVNVFARDLLPEWVSYILIILFGGWCAYNWIGIIPSKAKVRDILARYIYRKLTPPQ